MNNKNQESKNNGSNDEQVINNATAGKRNSN
jgi:hypothetical protein